MYMILNLYKENFLDDVMMALTEASVDETIILSGEALSHKIAFDMPIFAGFRESVGSEKGYAKIIMAVAEPDQIDMMLEALQGAGINFVEDHIGKIIILPVEKII